MTREAGEAVERTGGNCTSRLGLMGQRCTPPAASWYPPLLSFVFNFNRKLQLPTLHYDVTRGCVCMYSNYQLVCACIHQQCYSILIQVYSNALEGYFKTVTLVVTHTVENTKRTKTFFTSNRINTQIFTNVYYYLPWHYIRPY